MRRGRPRERVTGSDSHRPGARQPAVAAAGPDQPAGWSRGCRWPTWPPKAPSRSPPPSSRAAVALLGFGLDSVIEALASIMVVWRFTGTRTLAQAAERRAQQAVAVTYFLLAPCIAADAVRTLVTGEHPAVTWPGIAVSAASLIVMPLLGIAKQRIGTRLASAAVRGEGTENLICAYLAAAVLAGLLANTALGWWRGRPGHSARHRRHGRTRRPRDLGRRGRRGTVSAASSAGTRVPGSGTRRGNSPAGLAAPGFPAGCASEFASLTGDSGDERVQGTGGAGTGGAGTGAAVPGRGARRRRAVRGIWRPPGGGHAGLGHEQDGGAR